MDTTVGRQLRCVCGSVVPLGRYYDLWTTSGLGRKLATGDAEGRKLQVSTFFFKTKMCF